MPGPLQGGRAWCWFLCAAAMYLAILAVTWASDKGPNTIDLVPFRSQVRAIREGQHGHLAWRALRKPFKHRDHLHWLARSGLSSCRLMCRSLRPAMPPAYTSSTVAYWPLPGPSFGPGGLLGSNA
jgi:hypothetical protein